MKDSTANGIFPVPVEEKYFDGAYQLQSICSQNGFFEFYKEIDSYSKDFTFAENFQLAKEEYTISVTDSGVHIEYSSEVGKFRAVTSLYQLIAGKKSVQYCRIHDEPQFPKRGYMLTVGTHYYSGAIPTVERICKCVDMIAFMKCNEFQLYIDDFSFKYDTYPKYTEDYECLTPEDIEFIDSYCSERFVDLVPCQNGFGHMATWLREDEFKSLAISDGECESASLNPLDKGSFEFVSNLYASVLPHFKSEFVNIGCDEVFELGKFQTEEICKEQGRLNVYMDFVLKLMELARDKYGKRAQFWGDMIVDHPEMYKRIPKDAIVLEWDYEYIQSQRMEQRCRNMNEHGVHYYVCPSINTHIAFTGRMDVTTFNLRTAAEVGRDHGAEGYLITNWHWYDESFTILPAAIGAQYAWNVGAKQDGESFKTDFIYAAEDFCDKYIYKANLSRLIYRYSNYYLLEPERMHVATMSGYTFDCSMDFKKSQLLNFEKCADVFYFNNLERYIKDLMVQTDEAQCGEDIKLELNLAAHKILLANMLNKVRVNKRISAAEYAECAQLRNRIETDNDMLWNKMFYPVYKENFIERMNKRMEELKAFVV